MTSLEFDLIQNIPASVYWKDINSIIMGSNITHAKLTGFSRPDEVIGKTEYDFVWEQQAASIIENDRRIIQSGIMCKLEETATLKDGVVHTFLSSKEPLRDKENNIIGIIGISLDITEQKKIGHEFHHAKLPAEAANQLKPSKFFNYGKVVFSYREAQCLHYFLNHYSAQKASEKLFISPKTVESHLVKIKKKLNCYDTSQISKLAIEHGFIELMFMKF
ncbi:MAG: PAS domain-containing protein [Tatlockia sp.]|nr:PAS domain-containing protein [Tatlockia sp.]